MESVGTWQHECHPDHPQPCALWTVAATAVAGCKGGTSGDCRPGAVRVATGGPQHLCRHSRHQRSCAGSSGCDGPYVRPASLARRAAAGDAGVIVRNSCRRGDHHRGGTIAAAIGAGGLGEFIFRGIAMVDNGVILAGAIPAALMALVADLSLSGVEKLLVRRIQ